MEFNGLMGGFYKICEWIMRLSTINVLWVVCSLPFFYLALAGLYSGGPEVLPMMGILAPFTLFPATAAMFAVARKWVSGDADVPLLKTFFRSYKENYKQSMLGGIIFLILGAVIYTNYQFYHKQSGVLSVLSILFITFTVVMTAAFFNFFSIMVHLHMKFWQLVKNSILITVGQPINSIVILVLNITILYVSLVKFTFLVPFFMGSLMAIISFFMFYRSFNLLQSKHLATEGDVAAEQQEEGENTGSGHTSFGRQPGWSKEQSDQGDHDGKKTENSAETLPKKGKSVD